MSSIFTKIIKGEIPCYKIAEDENYLAFLDINPLAKGHTLVIPKKEVDYYFHLGGDDLCGLTLFSKKVAEALKKVIPCKKIGLTVIGLEVPHVHIHLIPINTITDMTFGKGHLTFEKEEMIAIAESIRQHIQLD